ncbi:uncharacterized protein LOC103962781 [Pyrus x bretschneideri]|uniref:uncharacterized protein LOC103962781 n=1 Tax=Pyrus x bretschneideri TaxID=225117 RepID=UPI00203004B7|nr:uncharacterized protein LOC103962781 [Pyrus x bretschneideri]XP_048440506.1 uncharacterized protein LOC103962781 [Pyrus x bretschneideri]
MSQLITRRRSVTNAPPALSASMAPAVSAPLISEPTPFAEATPTASQVPVSSTSSVSVEHLSARRPHRRRREPEPSDHTSSESRVECEASHPAKKNTRGPSRMLKQSQSARQAASKIKIVYDAQHRGAATSQQHSFIASSCGVVIRDYCPFQWECWAEIPEETKRMVRHELSVIYDLEDISLEVMNYLEETLANRYKNWKSTFHTFFKRWDDPEIARLHVPSELKDRPDDWEWLCKHFTDPKFVKKSVAGQKARESKTLLHHSGSKPFSYRLQTRRQEGSKFPAIDMFKDVYVRPGQEITEQFHATMVEKSTSVLQEATSQLPPETPIEDVTIPEDVGFQIMTDVLDQNLGRRRGKVVRCMGKAQIRETGASSSRSNAEVDALKEEVTTLKAQGEQMKEQLRVQGEEMRSYAGAWRDLVQAIQMSGLQISLPALHLGRPSTSEPPRPADT